MIEQWQLQQRLKLPLNVKIIMSIIRIQEWYTHFNGEVYISFSGGKDSTVLLHLVRSIFPDVEAVFCDTGLEYPEIRKHVKLIENVTWIKPKLNFKEVLKKYGYPIISKEISEKIYKYKNYNLSEDFRNYLLNGNEKGSIGMIPKKWQYLLNEDIPIGSKCCNVMKKRPFHIYEKVNKKKPFIGTMAIESSLRKQKYMQNGCNSFESKKQTSQPLAFWTEQDILEYIKINNLIIPSIYGEIYREDNILKLSGVKRTGCMFCCYGVHREKCPNRFQMMEKTHNKLWNYCMYDLELKKVLELINVDYKCEKVSKKKYKILTKQISIRLDTQKLNKIKIIYSTSSNTQIIDNLIDLYYQKIKKIKNNFPSGEKNIGINKAKYKIPTSKINLRVDDKKITAIKSSLNLKSNTELIDFLVDEKLKSVGHF
jgi:3'-phosphoadenosine 5'-phosphosulfate sulfotransferase (PAPS reductase)/FAD synthetase